MYEEIIQELEKSGDYKIIRRLKPVERYCDDDSEEKHIGLYLDVETTGLDSNEDKIIELAMIPFEYSASGKIYRVLPDYTSYQDPGIPLPAITTKVTGITDDMVAGHSVDMNRLDELLSQADMVIAHNAQFDRGFMENFHDGFKSIAWGCSLSDINWVDEGARSRTLSDLANDYGFFYDAHRATIDCQAGIELLSKNLMNSHEPVLKRLLVTAMKSTYRLWAVNSPFDKKDVLKQRGYRWSPGEGDEPKSWYIDVEDSELNNELLFLSDVLKMKDVTKLPKKKMDALNRYSNRK